MDRDFGKIVKFDTLDGIKKRNEGNSITGNLPEHATKELARRAEKSKRNKKIATVFLIVYAVALVVYKLYLGV